MNQRVAIAIEENLNGIPKVTEHFGRCSRFLIFELDENKHVIKKESYFNPFNGEEGRVSQLPAYVNQYDVNTIIAGGMGAKAINNFHSFKIDVITAPGVDCGDALNSFREGKLSGNEECAGHSYNF